MIVCFSGTGNSLTVAKELAALARDTVWPLGEPLSSPPAIAPGENIVWVMPCHSWGMPKWVAKALKTLPIAGAEQSDHFLVMTCGDDIGLAHLQWRNAIKRRGWKPVGTYSVAMPNTYILLPGFDVDAPEIANHKLQEMPSRVARIWHGIKCRARVDDVVRGAVPWIKTRLVYPLFMRFLTSPKPFHFTDACIGCGLCARVCPLKNISMQQNHPHWGKDCTLCLGCYHACPTHAVAYGHATDHKAQKQTVNISR